MVRDWLCKRKDIITLKRLIRGRLHCWFCLKLLRDCYVMLCYRWSAYNIPNFSISEYLTTNTSNFGVNKYYMKKQV
jgi:hypothetical protein